MPLYMDVHNQVRAVTPQGIAKRHARDLELQEKHGVKYINCWANQSNGRMFCLMEAPNKEAIYQMHREAHGIMFNDIYEVFEVDSPEESR